MEVGRGSALPLCLLHEPPRRHNAGVACYPGRLIFSPPLVLALFEFESR
jgi:hypothetical protein